MKAHTVIQLKSMLAVLISTIVCTVIASGAFLFCDILEIFINRGDWQLIFSFALYGVLAGIACEIAARLYEKKSRNRLRNRWVYIWRVSYAGFLYMDMFLCILATIFTYC